MKDDWELLFADEGYYEMNFQSAIEVTFHDYDEDVMEGPLYRSITGYVSTKMTRAHGSLFLFDARKLLHGNWKDQKYYSRMDWNIRFYSLLQKPCEWR